ncbi:acetyltransferase [Lachnospiraceae bacterium KM106-2]|nr:acetyltransferase [Lachnospiraceae bacterium KM106-2]
MIVEALIKELAVRGFTIKDNQPELIYPLYVSNEEYAKISKNYPVTFEYVIEEIQDIPPFTDAAHKHYFSIFNAEEELVAVLDIVDGYSYQDKHDKDSVWIGLFQIDKAFHRKKIGQYIIEAFINACKQNQRKVIQLGVIKENHAGLAFWKKQGFITFAEASNGTCDVFVMQQII